MGTWLRVPQRVFFECFVALLGLKKHQKALKKSEGPKGGRRKGGRGRKLSHFSFCCAFRCCVVYSPCLPVWGEEKVMTIYDAGPLAAGPLCGLLKKHSLGLRARCPKAFKKHSEGHFPTQSPGHSCKWRPGSQAQSTKTPYPGYTNLRVGPKKTIITDI